MLQKYNYIQPIFQINKYPWVVSITVPGFNHYCGGTLVASKYVVTAAHCMWVDQAETQPRPVADITVNKNQPYPLV